MLAKSNCLRGSSSKFVLRIYFQSLSRKRVIRKAAGVWCQGCLPLERLIYTCLMESFYPGFNEFSLYSNLDDKVTQIKENVCIYVLFLDVYINIEIYLFTYKQFCKIKLILITFFCITLCMIGY